MCVFTVDMRRVLSWILAKGWKFVVTWWIQSDVNSSNLKKRGSKHSSIFLGTRSVTTTVWILSKIVLNGWSNE